MRLAGGPVIPNFGHGSSCVQGDHAFCWDWVRQHWGDTLGPALLQHVELVAIAVAIGFALAFPLAGGQEDLVLEEAAVGAYTLVILFPNIVTGLRSAPAEVIEAARGMGLTRTQMLWRVELPLAVPAIIAGLRIAVVSTVAIATIAATLLPKGLGYPMLLALAEPTPFKTEIYSTGLLAVALALSCDFALVGLRRALVPWASQRLA